MVVNTLSLLQGMQKSVQVSNNLVLQMFFL